MLILRDAFMGVRRFDDFQRDLGIARNVLTDRIATLVEHDIFERREYQAHPARFEYLLTDKGLDLYPVLVALLRWGDRWTSDGAGPPVALEHRACGHRGTPVLVCPHCQDEVSAESMRARYRVGNGPPGSALGR